MASDRIHELTQRERECLRLVSRDRSSKQIGLELGISPHTVDVRLKRAIRLLGVASRFDAARLLAEDESGVFTSYQPLVSQPPPLPSAASDVLKDPRRSDGAGTRRPLPFLRQGRRSNDLTPAQRLFWIVAGAVVILIAFANFANAIDVLQTLTHRAGH